MLVVEWLHFGLVHRDDACPRQIDRSDAQAIVKQLVEIDGNEFRFGRQRCQATIKAIGREALPFRAVVPAGRLIKVADQRSAT